MTARLLMNTPIAALTLALLLGLPWPTRADAGEADAQALVAEYIAAWKAFYPSRAFAYGDRESAARFEDFEGDRVAAWLALNESTAARAEALLAGDDLSLATRTDLKVLRGQALDEPAGWQEDEPLARQAQWFAGRISQALTHLMVRDQLSPEARREALLARLEGVTRLARLGVETLEGGNVQRSQRAVRTLLGTRQFYEHGLKGLLATWPDDVMSGEQGAAISAAIDDAVAAIFALEQHVELLIPTMSDPVAIGAEHYGAKLARRNGGLVTPTELLDGALQEMQDVRALMIEESERWRQSLGPDAGVSPDLAGEDLLAAALDAMEADRRDDQATFLEQFVTLTEASERFVEAHDIATVPKPTTLYIALSPAHFSGAAVGGVYPSGPFDPEADTLFYVPSVPDEAPEDMREGFYRSFNDHFNAMIISHEMFPGHYLQYKVAVSEAPPVRSLFSNGVYIEGWGSYVEELLLDAGWADNVPLTRLAHLRKRLENATRATVSVKVHTAGWGREEVLTFAREEGLLAPQFAENLWQRVANSPLQITDYYSGFAQFKTLYETRREGPVRDWVDAILRAGPVPMELLPPLLAQ